MDTFQTPTPTAPQPARLPGIDFNTVRAAFAREIQRVSGLDQNRVVYKEAEAPNSPRPKPPYIAFKITTPSAKSGDDSKQNVLDSQGNGTTIWNSGGVRQMTVEFDCYGRSHEEAYNYMSLWQTALDLEDVQAILRQVGVAVWVIGTVADLSALLNTAYEGRAHMDCTFGIAMNLQSDLGAIEIVPVAGKVTTDQGVIEDIDVTVTLPEEG